MRVAQAEGARAFIHPTKRLTSPCDAADASASAALFALWMSAPASRSLTVTRSPADSGMRDSPTCAASPLTVTTSVGFRCFRAMSTVMSFVMLAIGIASCALCDASTSPVGRVHDEERARVGVRHGRSRRTGEPERDDGYENQPAHAAEGYFTRSFCPTCSEFVLTPGLSCSI